MTRNFSLSSWEPTGDPFCPACRDEPKKDGQGMKGVHPVAVIADEVGTPSDSYGAHR